MAQHNSPTPPATFRTQGVIRIDAPARYERTSSQCKGRASKRALTHCCRVGLADRWNCPSYGAYQGYEVTSRSAFGTYGSSRVMADRSTDPYFGWEKKSKARRKEGVFGFAARSL